MMKKLLIKLLGKRLATILRIYNPPGVSENNIVIRAVVFEED